MKIGISTASFSFMETEKALEKIASFGAETADICLRTYYEYRPEFAKELIKSAEGLEISSIRTHSEHFEHNLLSSDRRIRGDGLYWLDEVLRLSRAINSKRCVLSFSNLPHDVSKSDLSPVSNACLAYETKFCISNAPRGLCEKPGDFRALKKDCPQLFGALDLEGARLSCRPYLMYICDMGQSLDEIFVSDLSDEGPCLPGEGKTDFTELFEKLADKGFCGDVIVDAPCPRDDARLKACVEYLKDSALKAGL